MINQLHSENHSGGAAIGVAFFRFKRGFKLKSPFIQGVSVSEKLMRCFLMRHSGRLAQQRNKLMNLAFVTDGFKTSLKHCTRTLSSCDHGLTAQEH